MSNVEGYSFSYVENAKSENEIKAKAAKEGGSWLMALAAILGEIADKMMTEVVGLAKELDNLQEAQKDNPDAKSKSGMSENELTARLQGQTQIMNMFMQAMNTIIKSIGEANKDVARKQ